MSIKPPRPPSPPLNALRAFEAAARLGGFKAAGAELSVTPGAIAQQVKQLEAWAGAPLFERNAQGVSLNAAGRAVLPSLSEAFDALGGAVHVLNTVTRPNTVRIAALPAIAQLWLAPRMALLRQEIPELVLSITALEEPPNLDREPYDISLFYRADAGEVLERDVIFPVCAPELAAQLRNPSDLAHVPCLNDSVWRSDWAEWLEAAEHTGLGISGPTHSLYALAVEDALNGSGVLIGHEALVRRHLQIGALVEPFGTRKELPRALSMVTREGAGTKVLKRVQNLLSGESSL